jgi:hypothetical protein
LFWPGLSSLSLKSQIMNLPILTTPSQHFCVCNNWHKWDKENLIVLSKDTLLILKKSPYLEILWKDFIILWSHCMFCRSFLSHLDNVNWLINARSFLRCLELMLSNKTDNENIAPTWQNNSLLTPKHWGRPLFSVYLAFPDIDGFTNKILQKA